MTIELFKSVKSFLNIKTTTAEALGRLGIETISDLLLHKPHNYLQRTLSADLSRLSAGDRIIAKVTIAEITPRQNRRPMKIYAHNETGGITLVFFNKIPGFILPRLKIGSKITISGKVDFNDFYYQIAHPDFIWNDLTLSPIEPIYPLTYGINNKQIQDYVQKAIDLVDAKIDPALNSTLHEFISAIKIIHSPSNFDDIKRATNILARFELLSNQLALGLIRKRNHLEHGHTFPKASYYQEKVLNNLDFTLSDGQAKILSEIEQDQMHPFRMARMLQGDVGSGKTLVALMTMLNVANQNMQSALMAPTDLLASQHYNFFCKALEGIGIEVALLTSKTKAKDRKEILAKLESGKILFLIGTHSLFQNKVIFNNLGYIIIDEQHKFGVEQRLELLRKAEKPDLLIMTATPIPRSLTMTLFGDMAVSRLMQKPTSRPAITTIVKHSSKISEVIDALNRKIEQDEKIYWVCPLIESLKEEENKKNMTDVTSRFAELHKYFGDKVGLIHGKMSAEEKDNAMQEFKGGHLSILVATTVIEVGIDVPEATLIIIENAQLYGLAQLHQLRGRVGRGDKPSFCILLYNFASNIGKERLNIMKSSNDGFYISEKDLILRGGGEILGTKQSGQQDFKFANLAEDMNLLVSCNEKANSMLLSNDYDDVSIHPSCHSSEDGNPKKSNLTNMGHAFIIDPRLRRNDSGAGGKCLHDDGIKTISKMFKYDLTTLT